MGDQVKPADTNIQAEIEALNRGIKLLDQEIEKHRQTTSAINNQIASASSLSKLYNDLIQSQDRLAELQRQGVSSILDPTTGKQTEYGKVLETRNKLQKELETRTGKSVDLNKLDEMLENKSIVDSSIEDLKTKRDNVENKLNQVKKEKDKHTSQKNALEEQLKPKSQDPPPSTGEQPNNQGQEQLTPEIRKARIDNAVQETKTALTNLASSDASLGIDQTSIKPMSSTDDNAKEELDKMIAENDKADGKKTHYIKDISPEKNGSDISVVSVDREKEKDHEKTEQALKAQGYEKAENKDGTVASKFAERCEEHKESTGSGEVSNRASDDSSSDSENGGANSESGSTTTEETKELSYNDKKASLEKEGLKEYKKDDKLVIAGHEVPYVKVNGNNKIRFPKYEKIMGLPPLRIFTNDTSNPSTNIGNNTADVFDVDINSEDPNDIKLTKEYFLYNVDEMLNDSFPILTISPLDCEYIMGANGVLRTETQYNKTRDKARENPSFRYNVVDDIVYKFAVRTDNTISYSHQNTFAQTSLETDFMSNAEKFGNIAREWGGIAQSASGFDSNALSKLAQKGMTLGGDLDRKVAEITDAGNASAKETLGGSEIWDSLKSGIDFARSVVGGGRIDFPDAWQNSQTSFQQSFTIELRTLNPDPTSDQYFKELILPLYILLTLSLPTEGEVFTYKTPPLITCSLDNSFMEILFGAVTQINWSFDTKEINLKKVPWHCTVNITIRDLYSVMSQATYSTKNEKYVKTSNKEIMTKEKYFENFIRTKDKKIPNEKYYLTEFAKVPAYMDALEQRMKKEQDAANEQDKKKSTNSPENKAGSGQGTTTAKGVDGTQTGKETSPADKSAELKKDPKTGKTSLVQSIGGFVTGITKGIKNAVAGVNKAIPKVRQLINTGMVVLNTANNLKCAVKCVGQTANIGGILNGSFAASVGLAFDNLADASSVFSNLSGGVLGPAFKSVGKICNTLSDIGRSALTLDLPSCVSEDGKTVNLADTIKVAGSVIRAVGISARSIANTVQSAKMIGQMASDPLQALQTYVSAANNIINDVDFADRLLNHTKGSAIATGQYTAGELASDATTLEKFAYVSNTVAANAASALDTMFNTTLAEYMVQQAWFSKYFQVKPTAPSNSDKNTPVTMKDIEYKRGKTSTSDSSVTVEGVSEVTGLTPAQATDAMGKINDMFTKFGDGMEKFTGSCGDITIQSAVSGMANVMNDVPVTAVITANGKSDTPTAGGTVTL